MSNVCRVMRIEWTADFPAVPEIWNVDLTGPANKTCTRVRDILIPALAQVFCLVRLAVALQDLHTLFAGSVFCTLTKVSY